MAGAASSSAATLALAALGGCAADQGWEAPQPLPTGRVVDFDLAAGPAGEVFVVWREWDPDTGNADVLAARRDRDAGWGPSARLETRDTHASPMIAADAAGNAMAIWTHGIGCCLESSRFEPGTGWGAPTIIDGGDDAVRSRMVFDPAGNATLVWNTLPGDVVADRFEPGTGWLGATKLDAGPATPGEDYPNMPDVGVDASGNAIVVWRRGVDVWANRFVPGDGWSGPTSIGPYAGPLDYDATSIAVDRDGNATVVWDSYDGVHANRFTPAAGWASSSTLAPGGSGPAIAVDSAGAVTAVWCGAADGFARVFAQRLVGDAGWTAPVLVSHASVEGDARGAEVAVASDDRVTAIWAQEHPSPDPAASGPWIASVYANQLVPGTGWAEPVALELDPVAQFALDASSVATVAWCRDRGDDCDIYLRSSREQP